MSNVSINNYVNYCYSEIQNLSNNFFKFINISKRKYHLEPIKLYNLKRITNIFNFSFRIIEYSYENKISFRKALDLKIFLNKKLGSNSKSKRMTFYRFLKRLNLLFNSEINFKEYYWQNIFEDILFFKSKKQNNLNFKYSKEERKMISDYFYKTDSSYSDFVGMNKTNIWIKLKNQEILHNFTKDKFNNISLKTICKIINADSRSSFIPKKIIKQHPLRKYELDVGNIQMDIKVIGRKESPFKKAIYIFDAIDEETKVVYSKILKTQTAQELLIVVDEMITYYDKLHLKIKRIRTDNAMVFKKTNFLKSGILNKYLKFKNIKHEFIGLAEPQSNGCIERHHRNIDCEVMNWSKNCKNEFEFSKILNSWIEVHNSKRYRFYSAWNKTKHKDNFGIPLQVLNKINQKNK